MDMLLVLGLISLTAFTVVLLLAFLRARRSTRELAVQLMEAREQQYQDKKQLSERSQLDRLKDEFISTVSHELRTPLTSIRGALGLLVSGTMGEMDPRALNLLRIATTNTDRLIRLINDILDLERMESGRAPLQIRRCSLHDLCQQAIETMTPMAENHTVHLELVPYVSGQTGSTNSLFFDGDPDRILQVLTNLLSNAIKFSPPASTVRVHIDATSDSILVKVVDEGRGIPTDKLDSIFDRFEQVEHADAKQRGGTGLGLSICRSIVQQHSGSIWAQRNPIKGTTLFVMLPRTARASDLPLPETTPLGASSQQEILLCDDDPGVRTVVAENLMRRGYTVIEASSGEEVLRLASKQSFGAILLDLYMPGLSGWETLQRLRNNPVTAAIPVVVLSVLSSDLRSQLAGEAQGWVQKPFNENHLFAELSRVLHHGEGSAHILLVEDDEDLASVLIANFRDASVQVEHVQNRQMAIRHCLNRRPDLLILDLTLPDGDGFSLVEWLRQQPQLQSIPLVVYSGRELSDIERTKLRLGPTEFLTKAKIQPQEVEGLVLSMLHQVRNRFTNLLSREPAA
ncbi:response regulator [Edaphobacter albus]|uniref:response regulator n=1 Tax=Edaphobacter sp. 4G125 TaxID=2763071 RepID=UPI00164606B7|nr:response regulator [Edaphobacter sp. 4G125]QNI38298.1 response regulator [Edaphobacter sp. 4G125]